MRIWMLPVLLIALVHVASFAAPALKGGGTAIYFPTTVGAKWVYETDAKMLESVIIAAIEKDGDDLIITREGVDGTRTIYSKMVVSAEGIRQERELTDGKIGWVLKSKLATGTSWEMPEGGKRTVHGPEEITVMAGKFKALRVVWEQAGSTYTSWYAPGVGEIKRIQKIGDTTTVRRELKSFELKEAKK